MHILILHMRFHPDLTGTGPLVTELAADLAASGERVIVVTSMPHYGRGRVPPRYRGRGFLRERHRGVRVVRTFVYVPPRPSGFHRSLNYLSYTLGSTAAGILSVRPDVVMCVNPPITVGLSGWIVSLARRAPMVFNVQDIWPDCLEIVGQVRSRPLLYLFRHLEAFIYRVSSRVTVLSGGMKRNLLKKGVPPSRIEIVPNWADLDRIPPVAKDNAFRRTHNPGKGFLVLFAGNIGFNAVLDTVLEAAARIGVDRNILFLVVGRGNARPALVQKARDLGLENVRFLPTQPVEVLPEMLGAADLCLVTLHRGLGALNVPSKVLAAMAAGRPVLASVPADSEIVRIVGEAQCGVCVPPEDPRALADTVVDLSAQPDLLQRFGAKGRRYAELHFDRKAITGRYRELLREVVSHGGRQGR